MDSFYNKSDQNIKPHHTKSHSFICNSDFLKQMTDFSHCIGDIVYKFSWKSNSDPYNSNEIEEWTVYDPSHQIYLNQKYQEYLQDSSKFIVNLLSPSNYAINFKKNNQFLITNEYRSRPIKIEKQENLHETISPNLSLSTESNSISNSNASSIKIYEENSAFFFWQSNQDPWNLKETVSWTPYDIENEVIIRKAYQDFRSNHKKIVDLKPPSDYYIDFQSKKSEILQINKYDKNRKRPVKYCEPNGLQNIFREGRFDNEQFLNKSKIKLESIIINNETLNKNDELLKTMHILNQESCEKLYKVNFNVFSDFEIELEIQEQLCSFPNKYSIQNKLEEIKKIIDDEIKNLGKDKFDVSINYYSQYIKDIKDCYTFFEIILKIFSVEGFLKKNLNQFLRKKEKDNINKIKYYYISLLSSFKFINFKNSELKSVFPNEDLIVYRATKSSNTEEVDEYKKSNNKNILRIFNEFLSTSLNPKFPVKYFDKNNKNVLEFFWQIKIPKEIILKDNSNFINLSKFSVFPTEEELILRSGALIEIEEIIPYTEVINGEIITYPNKFKKICILKNSVLCTFTKLIFFHSSVHNLDLWGNKIGENQNYMLLLKEGLRKNQGIRSLSMMGNNLGRNAFCMFYLKEILEENTSIFDLNLNNNILGESQESIIYIKESLEKNNTIKKFSISDNNLGANVNNMYYLKEAILKNDSVLILDLAKNNLGNSEDNIKFIQSFLKCNNSLKELDLQKNNFGQVKNSILLLKDALIDNKHITKVNLMNNGFKEKNNNVIQNIKEIIEKNKVLVKLNLIGNEFEDIEKYHLRKLNNIKLFV